MDFSLSGTAWWQGRGMEGEKKGREGREGVLPRSRLAR